MKKRKIKQNSKSRKEKVILAVIVLGFAAALGLFAWWQISPWTYREFSTICEANGGGGCMKFYWEQLNYYQWVLKGSVVVAVISAGAAIYLALSPERNSNS